MTNAFIKKQQKLPKGEKDKALRLMADYQYRVQKENYYDEED